MAKTKITKPHKSKTEFDRTYFLKLVLYLIVGSQWLRISTGSSNAQIPLPIGLGIGLLFVSHDHFRIDRKIETALLLVAMLVGFYGQVGIAITV